jgi:L-cystine transport system substrate-binding protein
MNRYRVRSSLRLMLSCMTLLVTSASHAQADTSLSALRQAGVITIANTQESPPWSSIDQHNEPAGYDVDVAHEVAKRIGVAKVTFVADTFSNFVDGLRTGKYDIVVNSMAATTERKKIVDFSDAYAPQEFRIWVNARSGDIKGVTDLAGKNIGVGAGTSNEVWARAHLPNSTIHSYDNSGFLYGDLAAGRVDALIESHFAGQKERDINHLPIKEVGPPLTISLGCVAIPKNKPALVGAINKAIADMVADGTLEKLGHKWLGADYDVVGDIQKVTGK